MNRDDSIDIAKCLAIIFVVLGHALEAPVAWQHCLRNYIVSFHMAMFFFLSGWFFDIQRTKSKFRFVVRKIKGLWWPYVKWMWVFIILHNAFCGIYCYGSFRGGPIPSIYSFADITRNLAMTLTFRGGDQLLGGFWFIPALFYAAIFSLFATWSVQRIFERFLVRWHCACCTKLLYIVIISGSISVAILMIIIDKGVPMYILPNIGCTTMLACASFMSGALVKTMERPVWFRPLPFVIITTLLLFIVSNIRLASVSIQNSPLDAPYALLTGVLGSMSWIIVSRWLSNALNRTFLTRLRSLILYIGRNTLVILALHFLCFKLINLLKVLRYNLPIGQVGAFPILVDGNQSVNGVCWVLLYVLVGVGIPIAFKYLKDILIQFVNGLTMIRGTCKVTLS